MIMNNKVTHNNIKWVDVNKAWELSKSWLRAPILWKTIEYILITGSFSSSIISVYIAGQYPDRRWIIIMLSSVAAICTLMQFAFNPAGYINSYRLAFEELNAALVKNSNSEGEFIGGDEGWNEIVQAIIKGEEYIGMTYCVSRASYKSNQKHC